MDSHDSLQGQKTDAQTPRCKAGAFISSDCPLACARSSVSTAQLPRKPHPARGDREVLDQDFTCPLPLITNGREWRSSSSFGVQHRAETIAASCLRGWGEVCSPRATQRCPGDDPDGGIPSVEGKAPLPQWQRKGKGLEFNLSELPAVSRQINTHTGTV